MNDNFAHKILDQLILLCLVGIFFVPFLIPYSLFPVPTLGKFSSELSAVVFSATVGFLAVWREEKLMLPVAFIACVAFAIFLVLQPMLVHTYFPGINYEVAIQCLCGASLAAGLASFIRGDEVRRHKLLVLIAILALISVLIQGLIGYLQFFGIAAKLNGLVLYGAMHDGGQVFGNIGQKNDYGDFMAIGLFALVYLYFIRKVPFWFFACGQLFLLLLLSLNNSRTTFLYFIASLLFSGVLYLKNRKASTEVKQVYVRLFKIIFSIFITLIIIQLVLPYILKITHINSDMSALQRLNVKTASQSTYRRFYEWYKDIILFTQHPLFGIGWYQFGREGIYIMLSKTFWYIPANSALYSHSHDTPLNILAETGIVGFCITMIYGVGYTIYRMFKNFNNLDTVFLVLMWSPLFIQGLFQYPLWYAYFLMIFILFLSLDSAVFVVKNNGYIKIIASLVFLLFACFVYQNNQVYNQAITYTQVPQDSDDFARNVHQLQSLVDNTSSVWSYPLMFVLTNYNMPGNQLTNMVLSPQQQIKYADMMGNISPFVSILYNQMVFYRLYGDNEKSLFYANLIAHAFPYFKDGIAQQLSSNPMFESEINVIKNFHYTEDSIFSRWLHYNISY